MSRKGFSIIEILLALAIAAIVFIAIFHFASSVYVRNGEVKKMDEKRFMYTYGETYCRMGHLKDIDSIEQHVISLDAFISTSTRVTSAHVLFQAPHTQILITTDSASTTEPDVFVFTILENGVELVASKDIGPGVQDSKLLQDMLYVANTSVNSHIKVLDVDMGKTGSSTFQEIMNVKIGTLAQSASLPKRISIHNGHLLLGSEKSNAGGELFVLPIRKDGVLESIIETLEFEGQVNQAVSSFGKVFVAAASDPELTTLDSDLKTVSIYDAPLTLGNGKSVWHFPPYTVLGRTLGSGELSLLTATSTVLDIKRTDGTVDYIQPLDTSEPTAFLTLTSNERKELQFWHIEKTALGAKLKLAGTIDMPGRITAYSCALNRMYVFAFINNQATLIWLDL